MHAEPRRTRSSCSRSGPARLFRNLTPPCECLGSRSGHPSFRNRSAVRVAPANHPTASSRRINNKDWHAETQSRRAAEPQSLSRSRHTRRTCRQSTARHPVLFAALCAARGARVLSTSQPHRSAAIPLVARTPRPPRLRVQHSCLLFLCASASLCEPDPPAPLHRATGTIRRSVTGSAADRGRRE
jgi:hypothetical protein